MGEKSDILEGRWNCSSCDTKGIRGSIYVCPNCGRPRPEDVEFYLTYDAEVITDEKERQRAKAGLDWYCEHCGSGTSNMLQNCKRCGAPRGNSHNHDVNQDKVNERSFATGRQPTISTIDDHQANGRPPNGFRPSFIVMLVIIFGFIVWGLIAFLTPRQINLTVSSFSWERSINIEKYGVFTEGNWDVPSGGQIIQTKTKFHHNDQVIDHYNKKSRQVPERYLAGYETRTRQVSERVQTGTEEYCTGTRSLGNGYFEKTYSTRPVYETRYKTETYQEPVYQIRYRTEYYDDPVYRDVPVYKPYYTYRIGRWIHNRKEKAGDTNQKPIWPKTDIGSNEREGNRSENYVVYFSGKDKKGREINYKKELTLAEWQNFKINEIVRATIDLANILIKIEKIK